MKLDRTRLDDPAIAHRLDELSGWTRSGDTIRRDFVLDDFEHAMVFINAVADVARALDHHANLSNVYNRVSLELSTHDAGGLTEYDFAFASRVNALDL